MIINRLQVKVSRNENLHRLIVLTRRKAAGEGSEGKKQSLTVVCAREGRQKNMGGRSHGV